MNRVDPTGRLSVGEYIAGIRLNAALIYTTVTQVDIPFAVIKYGSVACLGFKAANLLDQASDFIEYLSTHDAENEAAPEGPLGIADEWCDQTKPLFGTP